MRVYIAGKYSDNNVLAVLNNMRKGIQAATKVFLAKMSPFCCWLDYHFVFQMNELEVDSIKVEDYYEYCIDWMKVADVVYVLPGFEDSKGTLAEIKLANELCIPIVYNFKDLLEFKKNRAL